MLLGESLDHPRGLTPAEMAADLEPVVAVLARRYGPRPPTWP
ncbi:hypothetical protein ACFVVU_35730 [Kitasatospora sp. NPDC057965]